MHELIEQQVQCPYCGETLQILIDSSAGSMDYIEDCQVCCQPIEFRLQVNLETGGFELFQRRDDA